MFFPTLDDNVSVFVYYFFNLLIVVRFDSLFLKQLKLGTIPIKLGHTAITFYMYV